MQFTVKVKVEWQQEDGTVASAELGRIDSDGLHSAADLGLKLSDTKPILAQLQNIVTKVQVRSHCQSVRSCPSCRAPSHNSLRETQLAAATRSSQEDTNSPASGRGAKGSWSGAHPDFIVRTRAVSGGRQLKPEQPDRSRSRNIDPSHLCEQGIHDRAHRHETRDHFLKNVTGLWPFFTLYFSALRAASLLRSVRAFCPSSPVQACR